VVRGDIGDEIIRVVESNRSVSKFDFHVVLQIIKLVTLPDLTGFRRTVIVRLLRYSQKIDGQTPR
jgi:hypothetical protein